MEIPKTMTSRNISVLIVEDSLTQALKLQYFLEQNGYRVSITPNGPEAIVLLTTGDLPDIIISDVVMPGMDGFEMCTIIKSDKRFKHIPILLLTNLSEPDDIIKGLECNADQFITKPYDEQFLLSRIQYILINEKIRNETTTDMGIQIFFAGKRHKINSNRIQILDLLLSTYENVLHKKKELEQANKELQTAIGTIEQLELEYRYIFQKTTDAIFVVSRKNCILFANPASEALLKQSVQELIGQPFEFPIQEKSPAIYGKILENNKSAVFEVKSEPITWQEQPAFLVTVRDITIFEQTRQDLQTNIVSLKDTISGTMQAIGKVIEHKAPFIAGHPRRVADLAYRIAFEMGLPEDKINGTRMAAYIHNIGYVQLSGEILNKHDVLTEAELEMVRSHTRIAYNFFNEIKFPWPLADILLQHHERWDGSGYPSGLCGEEILLEARILAVADVVDAMVSNRPHRPAHGLKESLEHLSANKGILYDPNVVDACLKRISD